MPALKVSLCCAVATVAVTSAALFFVTRARNAEAAQLAASNALMRQNGFEHQLASQRKATSPAAASAPRSAASGTGSDISSPRDAFDKPPATPPSDYRFEGQATPGAALQTFAWACDRGDTALMEKLITFESRAREKAAAYVTSLPAQARGQSANVETLAATLLVNEGMEHPLPHADFLAKGTAEKITEDLVRIRLPGTTRDGDLYQRIGQDWKFVITEKSVDTYLSRRSQK